MSKKDRTDSAKAVEIRRKFKLEKASELPAIRREFTTIASVVCGDFMSSGENLMKLALVGVNSSDELRSQVDAIRRYVRLNKLPIAIHKAGMEVYLERKK